MKTLLLITGMWRAVLGIQGETLPFNFELRESNSHYTMTIINGEERIAVDEISLKGDSLIARLPVFDSEIRVLVTEKSMTGNFINHSRKTNNIIPFQAEQGKNYRFVDHPKSTAKVQGKWETDFSPGTADSSKATGVFEQKENGIVYGTFLTTSGDYHYLEGCVTGDSLFLSTFNGAFVYLFKAKISGDSIHGMYFSGNHNKEPFVANRNEKFELPDPYSLTFLKKGFDKINFSLPDLQGKTVTLDDERFKNKVVIVQMMGSWCPNCLDESAFFGPVYEKYKNKGLEIVGIAFEKTADFSKAVSLVNRLKEKYHISYPLVIANRDSAAQTLPMLNKINGYPTTIYIGKKGVVRKIYTGFSGPATGEEYEKYKEDFFRLVEMLLTE